MVKTNKDLINADPFCDVDLKTLTDGENELNKVVVRLRDPDTNQMVPIDTLGAHHNKSTYSLITNRRVKQAADDVISRSGLDFSPLPTLGNTSPTMWDGRKYVDRYYSKTISADIQDGRGSKLMLGLQVTNSYDGSMTTSMEFFIMNLLCANQFYSAHLIAGFNLKHHVRAGQEIEIEVDDASRMLQTQAEEFGRVVPKFGALCSRTLSDEGGGDSFAGYMKVRNRLADVWKPSFEPQLLDELAGKGISSRLKLAPTGTPDSLWGLLNAYSAVATHHMSGFSGMAVNREVTDRILAMVS